MNLQAKVVTWDLVLTSASKGAAETVQASVWQRYIYAGTIWWEGGVLVEQKEGGHSVEYKLVAVWKFMSNKSVVVTISQHLPSNNTF